MLTQHDIFFPDNAFEPVQYGVVGLYIIGVGKLHRLFFLFIIYADRRLPFVLQQKAADFFKHFLGMLIFFHFDIDGRLLLCMKRFKQEAAVTIS